jgi:hypothetical protein
MKISIFCFVQEDPVAQQANLNSTNRKSTDQQDILVAKAAQAVQVDQVDREDQADQVAQVQEHNDVVQNENKPISSYPWLR